MAFYFDEVAPLAVMGQVNLHDEDGDGDQEVDGEVDEEVDEGVDEEVNEQVDEEVNEGVDEEVDEQVDEEERRNPRCNTMLRFLTQQAILQDRYTQIQKYTNYIS